MGAIMEKKELKKDDWAVVLDFLVRGHYGMDRPQPMAYVLGETYFSLLEVIVRDDIELKQGDRVYIGEKKREKIKYIKERIKVEDLSAAAREELEETIKEIIKKSPEQFVDFFNKAGQLTTRMHKLELLPGVGKKHLWAIIEERKAKSFKSFDDLKKRVPLLPDPEKMIIRRVLTELEDKDKYRLFVPKFEKKEKSTFKGEFRY